MHDQQGEVEEINVIDSMSVKCPDLITLIYTQTCTAVARTRMQSEHRAAMAGSSVGHQVCSTLACARVQAESGGYTCFHSCV